jgi:hypothetical protein
MNQIDYWRLAEELNVIQAALLILGLDPADHQDYIEQSSSEEKPKGYAAVSAALKNAVISDSLPATKDIQRSFSDPEIQWKTTLIRVENLRDWLLERNFTDGFFVDDRPRSMTFMEKDSQFYAHKLAAAVAAWNAVSLDENLLQGKSPKQALEKWLRENASQFGLTKEDGNPSETAIEEIAKVANWNQVGGATKTPTRSKLKPPTPNMLAHPSPQ